MSESPSYELTTDYFHVCFFKVIVCNSSLKASNWMSNVFLYNVVSPFDTTDSTSMTERIFDSRPFMCNKIFLKKTHIEVGSSHLYASFGTFCVQICHLFEAQWDFKLSEEFEIDVIFLRKQRFDAKGAKRSVKMWTTHF